MSEIPRSLKGNLLNARDRLGKTIIEIVAADVVAHGEEVIAALRQQKRRVPQDARTSSIGVPRVRKEWNVPRALSYSSPQWPLAKVPVAKRGGSQSLTAFQPRRGSGQLSVLCLPLVVTAGLEQLLTPISLEAGLFAY